MVEKHERLSPREREVLRGGVMRFPARGSVATLGLVARAVGLSIAVCAISCGPGGANDTAVPGASGGTSGPATADASPSASLFPCDQWPAPCAMLERIEDITASSDLPGLLSLWAPTIIECTEPLQGVDPPAELCEGAAAGELRAGYLVGNESRLVAVPDRSIRVLSPNIIAVTFTAVTIGCPGEAGAPDCSREYTIVFSWLDAAGVRHLTLYECDGLHNAIRARRTLLHSDGVTDILIAGGETRMHPLLPDQFTFLTLP